MSVLALCLALSAAAAASASQVVHNSLRHAKPEESRDEDLSSGFVSSLQFKHRLRVCNAYPYAAAMDVYRNKREKLTSTGPMPYKVCKDFLSPLKAGDKLEFKVGDASAGVFSVSDLPNNDAVLFLVIHRHDTLSTAVSFESHVFANLLNAQIAVIDTYRGAARATTKIMDARNEEGLEGLDGKKKLGRSESLRFDSVVAVNPGKYEVDLVGDDGETKSKQQLVARNRESYVVIRTGVEAQQGESYPQELIVFPMHTSAAVLRSPAALVVLLASLALGAAQW